MNIIKKWKILKKQDVSPSHWLPVFKHKVELPNNKIVDDFYIAKFPDVVMIMPMTKSGKIVFCKQYRHAIDKIMLELPAGMIQKGKTHKETAIAELEEEVGIKISENKLINIGFSSCMPHKFDYRVYSFLAMDLEFNSKQKLDENEQIEVVTLNPQIVLEKIKSEEIYSSDTVSLIFRVKLIYPEIFE
ncbi:NUDIX domain-containing protein [Candidatus Dojkabacteria bacterium]|nr:NUDIX domain-containing protein [Candidatus Dojkabacteria bacterium]